MTKPDLRHIGRRNRFDTQASLLPILTYDQACQHLRPLDPWATADWIAAMARQGRITINTARQILSAGVFRTRYDGRVGVQLPNPMPPLCADPIDTEPGIQPLPDLPEDTTHIAAEFPDPE